jgi:ferredoxin-NADP reductase
MEHAVKIKSVENVTHDVKKFTCEKPAGYFFTPGQATELSINQPGWTDEKRPFTFTSLPEAADLEFVIKIYSDHDGVTSKLGTLVSGDEVIVRDAWGAIEYKGPGYFIAGGAGITPFIAILRYLNARGRPDENYLLFSNKTERDIILENEFIAMLGDRAFFTITDEPTIKYHHGFINESFLKTHIKDVTRHFYLCGPPRMVEAMQQMLSTLGASADSVVFEK